MAVVELAFETPLKNLDLQVKFGDYLFVEAAWLDYPEYLNFVQVYGENVPVYLDNSAWLNGRSVNIQDYLATIEALRPDVAVVPDALGKKGETIKLTKAFFDAGPPEKQGTRYMIVPQGKNKDEWISCLHIMTRMFRHRFQMVGLPRVMYPIRLQLARHVQAFNKLPVHILGCVDPSEIAGILASPLTNVTSIDTSWVARSALNKKKGERIDFENDDVEFSAFENALEDFLQRVTPGRFRPTVIKGAS